MCGPSNWTVLAERELLIEEDGVEGRRPILLQISHPSWIDDNQSAACMIRITDVHGDLGPIHGVDFVQALQLAIAFADQILTSLPSGVRIFWPDGEPYKGLPLEPSTQVVS